MPTLEKQSLHHSVRLVNVSTRYSSHPLEIIMSCKIGGPKLSYYTCCSFPDIQVLHNIRFVPIYCG